MNTLDTEDKPFVIDDIQGNILRGYRYELVRYLILEITNRRVARRFLAASAEGRSDDVPAITNGAKWPTPQHKPASCFNIALTYEGLVALGVPSRDLATWPRDFTNGMKSAGAKIGDFGDSAFENWAPPFNTPERVHVIAAIYSNDKHLIDDIEQQVARAFTVSGTRDGRDLAGDKIFLGYRDSISQPKFKDIHDEDEDDVDEPPDPLGTLLLGYPTRNEGLRFSVPKPDVLGRNGSFSAFRILAQDAHAFEDYLDSAADTLLADPRADHLLPPGDEPKIGENLDRRAALREIVAAQMCGRWRNGVPYALSPDTQWPDPPVSLTNFEYDRRSRCPAGSHMRRVNPRGGSIVERIASYTRRLVRRGMSYGPDFDPDHRDDCERGLLGNFIGASISGQFEAVMSDWLNLGLLDPDITGSNDPLIGANAPETSWFDLLVKGGGTLRLRGFPRFVTVRGGAYTFLPSLPAIRYLSELTD